MANAHSYALPSLRDCVLGTTPTLLLLVLVLVLDYGFRDW